MLLVEGFSPHWRSHPPSCWGLPLGGEGRVSRRSAPGSWNGGGRRNHSRTSSSCSKACSGLVLFFICWRAHEPSEATAVSSTARNFNRRWIVIWFTLRQLKLWRNLLPRYLGARCSTCSRSGWSITWRAHAASPLCSSPIISIGTFTVNVPWLPYPIATAWRRPLVLNLIPLVKASSRVSSKNLLATTIEPNCASVALLKDALSN